jgi:hypothetical protein
MPKRPYLDEFRRDQDLTGLSILLSEKRGILLEVVHRFLGNPEEAWEGKASLLEDPGEDELVSSKVELYDHRFPTREKCIDVLENWLYGPGSIFLSGQPALARVVGDEEWV